MAILAVARPTFQRAMRIISDITNDYPALVTTTFAHQYLTGMIVRLNIPKTHGMQQANQLYGTIIVINPTQFTIDIDTTQMDPLVVVLNAGSTDGSGNASGTVSSNIVPFSLGQSFTIGDNEYLVINQSGALSPITPGSGSGTFSIFTGDYSFTGTDASTTIYFYSTIYPYNEQYPQCTPIGEINSMLAAATQNVLPYRS